MKAVPATVIVPVRLAPLVLAATAYVTVETKDNIGRIFPAAVLLPEVTVIQSTVLAAVQGQPTGALT